MKCSRCDKEATFSIEVFSPMSGVGQSLGSFSTWVCEWHSEWIKDKARCIANRYKVTPLVPMSRHEHARYAERHGYFWLPCPRCGKFFGGHESLENGTYPPFVQCTREEHSGHMACCAKVSDEEDAKACERVHERHAKEGVWTGERI